MESMPLPQAAGLPEVEDRSRLTRYALLAVSGAIITISMKYIAFLLTGSVGLYSDALEGLVNLAGAVGAFIALKVSARPPDDMHTYGHDKVEYFSSGAEGALIVVAALGIISASVNRLLHPQPLEQIDIGLAISLLAALVNFVVSRVLRAAGRKHDSIILEADARHLMADVWTSVGVAVGVGAAAITGLNWLDPIIGLLVAVNILWEGFHLVRRSVNGLMDAALPPEEAALLESVIRHHEAQHGLQTHEVRSRVSGSRRFIDMHVLVPGSWTVQQGHDVLEEMESDIARVLARTTVVTHLEPLEDPASWAHLGFVPEDLVTGADTPPEGQDGPPGV